MNITGQDIEIIRPIGSQYHNDCVNVYDSEDNHYLMKVDEVMKIKEGFNDTTFNVVQKRKHKYLEVQQ